MRNPMIFLFVSTAILMLIILNSCNTPEKKPDSLQLSISPLEKPVLAGQPFSFQILEEVVKENTIYWDFGDGTNETGTSVEHTYSNPGIYQISVYLGTENRKVKQSSAIIRVHTPETIDLPQVFLDTDSRCEADDQHYIAYALYSDLDILGINSIHNNEPGSEVINYGEIFYIMKLMNYSGKSWGSMPVGRIFHGATKKLVPPSSGIWSDTNPIVTEGSEAILAAARGAWPGNPAIILPVGPCTNIASAVLQARKEGFKLRDRIRVIWLGGLEKDYHKEYNGGNDPWSVYVMGQSGINLQILLGHPTSLKLNIDKRVESGLYPDNELGDYLKTIIPVFQWGSTTILKSIHDVCVPAKVISDYKGLGWVTKVEPVRVSGPDNDYQWQQADSTSTVHLIWDIDGKAMKTDLFNTLNGHPTKLIKE